MIGDKKRSVQSLLALVGMTRNRAIRMRRVRVAILALTLILSLTPFLPVRTVKGMLQNTGLGVGGLGISIDDNRIAFTSSTPNTVGVYDIPSAASTSFPLPAGTMVSTPVMISGNKIVVGACTAASSVCFTSFSALAAHGFPQFHGDMVVWPNSGAGGGSFSIYYCTLPNLVPISPCGPWALVPSAIPSAGMGFSYYRFSSGVTTSIATAMPIGWLSTNGQVIAFPSGGSLQYYDTLAPLPSVVDTGLPIGSFLSIAQETIAFTDNSVPTRIRYYDILRDQASPAGSGPLGSINPVGSAGIWADRIAFSVSESDLGFDCNGNAVISSSEYCLRYWNIHPRNFQASLLVVNAAPPIAASNSALAIYDKVIAFKGADNNLQIVFVPAKGDVDLDGQVGIIDLTETNICFFKTLLTSSQAPCSEA